MKNFKRRLRRIKFRLFKSHRVAWYNELMKNLAAHYQYEPQYVDMERPN